MRIPCDAMGSGFHGAYYTKPIRLQQVATAAAKDSKFGEGRAPSRPPWGVDCLTQRRRERRGGELSQDSPFPPQTAGEAIWRRSTDSTRDNNGSTLANTRRIATNARMMLMLTSIAAGERSTPLNIAIPFSVNAYGMYLRCSPRLPFQVPIWHLKQSSFVNWNMKSVGDNLFFCNFHFQSSQLQTCGCISRVASFSSSLNCLV